MRLPTVVRGSRTESQTDTPVALPRATGDPHTLYARKGPRVGVPKTNVVRTLSKTRDTPF